MGIAGTLLWSISAIVLDLVGDGENVQACTGRRSRGAREQGRGGIKLGSLKPWQSGRTRTAHMVGCWLLGPVCQSSHIDCTYHRKLLFHLCAPPVPPTYAPPMLPHVRSLVRSRHSLPYTRPRRLHEFLRPFVHSPQRAQVAASRGKSRQVGPVSARSGSPRHQKVCAKLGIKLYLYSLGGLPIACQSHPLRRFIDPSSFHNFIRRTSQFHRRIAGAYLRAPKLPLSQLASDI